MDVIQGLLKEQVDQTTELRLVKRNNMETDIDRKKLYAESVAAAGGREDPFKYDGYFITEYGTLFMSIGHQYYQFTPQGWERIHERTQELWYSNLWIEHDDVTSFLDIPTTISQRYHLNDYPIIDSSGKDKNQNNIIIDYFDRFQEKVREFLAEVQLDSDKSAPERQFVKSWDSHHFDIEKAMSEIDSADESFIVIQGDRILGVISASRGPLSEEHASEGDWSSSRKMEISYLAFTKSIPEADIGGMLLNRIKTNYRFQRFDTVIHVTELSKELSAVLQSNRYDFLVEGVYGIIRHEPDLLNVSVGFAKARQQKRHREKSHKSVPFRTLLSKLRK